MGERVLGLIPARAGSRNIPRKNIRSFLGKPLLAWSVEAALQDGTCDRVVLSTDDPEIADVGRGYGAEVPFLRPPALGADGTPTSLVVRHAVDWLQPTENWIPDYIIVLEPTSPGRQPFHICESIALLRKEGADSVASVTEVPHHYAACKQVKICGDGSLAGIDGTHPADMIHRRQDLPTCYAFDGAIFACRVKWILQESPTLWGDRVLAYKIDSRYSVDLDSPEDWVSAEARLRPLLLDRNP